MTKRLPKRRRIDPAVIAAMLFLTGLLPALPASAAFVTDAAGRSIEVPKPFTRIISLYGAHTENLFALGLDAEIIGVSDADDLPASAAPRSVFSYHDDAEKFMAARPDLVLIRPMIDRVYRMLVEKLTLAGITVVSLQPVGMEDMYRYWADMGTLTGRESDAREMIERFQSFLARMTHRLASVPTELRKRVYFEAIHAKMKTFAPDAMAMFVLKSAGGVNVAEDARQMRKTNIAAYGKERILAKADEIDVYLAQQGRMNPVTVADIMAEPGFSVIKAVREGKVYFIDEKIVSRPTLRLVDGISTLARLLYPELMAEPL